MSEKDERPTGRELRLVNAVIGLLNLLDPERLPPGITLTEPVLMNLDELRECVGLYKAHMLKPKMKRHTQIPVRIVGSSPAQDETARKETR